MKKNQYRNKQITNIVITLIIGVFSFIFMEDKELKFILLACGFLIIYFAFEIWLKREE